MEKNVKVVIISGTLKDEKLSKKFQKGLNRLIDESGRRLEVTVLIKAKAPEYLLENFDIIASDGVITWGDRKTLLPQIRRYQRENEIECQIISMPAIKSQRMKFFKKPAIFFERLEMIGAETVIEVKEEVKEEVKIPKEEVEVPKKEVWSRFSAQGGKRRCNFAHEKMLPNLPIMKILISIQGAESLMSGDLERILQESLPNDSIIEICDEFTAELVSSADVIVLNARKESRVTANGEEATFQSLVDIIKAKRAGFKGKFVLAGKLDDRIVKVYGRLISGLLELPPTKESVNFILREEICKKRKPTRSFCRKTGRY